MLLGFFYSYTSRYYLYTGQYGEKLLCVREGGGGGQVSSQGISVENGWMALFCFIYLFIFSVCVLPICC